MTSNNNMGSQNKLDKLEEKKKLELQFLKKKRFIIKRSYNKKK